MESERIAFIRAICAEPRDDTVRLVFADWLDEHGEDERAGDIRVGVGYLKTWIHHSRIQPVHRRYAWPRVGPEWITTDRLPDYCSHGVSHRGFLHAVSLTCDAFMQHVGDLFGKYPITEMRLTDKQPHESSEGWFWDRAGMPGDETLNHVVPTILFDHMEVASMGKDELADECKGHPYLYTIVPRQVPAGLLYLTPDRATTALSRACVAYGRWYAGLSFPLQDTTTVPAIACLPSEQNS